MRQPKQKRKMGLAVLAGGLAFVGSADATELIQDGSFENTKPSSNPVVKVGGSPNPAVDKGWSSFSTYLYSTLYTLPGPPNSGLQYLRPYPSGTYGITQSSQVVTQSVSLTTTTTLTPSKIDAGQGRFTLSAWFSSYLTQGDYSELTLQFFDASNNPVGSPVTLGGMEFVTNIPTGQNSKYANAKEFNQDSKNDVIPTGARTAQVRIAATQVNGAPDGYVDSVSLDVIDLAAGIPTVGTTDPPPNAVGVGPQVNISLTLQDRITAVNTNSIRLFLDDNRVSPSIEKNNTNTFVRFAAGLLPARSSHSYRIEFADTGSPATIQTNQFNFTVADYLTLPSSLGTPLGSENTAKPGFNVAVYQVDTLTEPDLPQPDLPASISFSEAVLAGRVAPNVADLAAAASGNMFEIPGVIDWINSSGATANFPVDQPFPGIPGTTSSENSAIHEIKTFIRFPAAGFYQMGINNEDQFRLTAATAGQMTLKLVAPTSLTVASVAIATNITQLQFGGSLPLTPLTAPIAYATRSGSLDAACSIATNTTLSGKIALVDRGTTNCTASAIAEQAQLAGAVAVLFTTPTDPSFPARIDDINPNVRIPVLVLGENFGGAQLKSYLTNNLTVTAAIQGDPNPRLAEWDGPKGFGAVDVTFGFAVPTAGVYPLRLVAGQGSGRANLEWFSIKPDGTRILINDTSTPDALRAFRARTEPSLLAFHRPVLSAGQITLSWSGNGTLQEAPSVLGPWASSPNQSNPQTIPVSPGAKFFRLTP